MAEYIAKDKLKTIMYNITAEFDTETVHIDRVVDEIDNLPTADVVERSKIDKAIEEIDFLRQHRTKYITEDNRICIDSGEVLQILKRNIEE